MLHTGYLYKMGNGPINFDWNLRYFVLDKENKNLTYFGNENDKKARGIINLSQGIVSNVMPIKGRNFCFTIRDNPKSKREFSLSAKNEEEAEQWISLINEVTPSNDIPSWKRKTITKDDDGRLTDPSMERKDTERRFPNTKDLFRKFRNRVTHMQKKGRKTRLTAVGAPAKKKKEAVSFEPEIKEERSVANFGSIPDEFKDQIEKVEKYLSSDDLFQLYKFESSSRITVFQRSSPLKLNQKAQTIWAGASGLILLMSLYLDFFYFILLVLSIVSILGYFKPLYQVDKTS